jgi:hypothetical protein
MLYFGSTKWRGEAMVSDLDPEAKKMASSASDYALNNCLNLRLLTC